MNADIRDFQAAVHALDLIRPEDKADFDFLRLLSKAQTVIVKHDDLRKTN